MEVTKGDVDEAQEHPETSEATLHAAHLWFVLSV